MEEKFSKRSIRPKPFAGVQFTRTRIQHAERGYSTMSDRAKAFRRTLQAGEALAQFFCLPFTHQQLSFVGIGHGEHEGAAVIRLDELYAAEIN